MTQLFDLNARIQQLTWSLIFYEKYSTSLSTIVLVVLTTANFGGFSNFCRYYTRSQAGKSTGYRPTLKPLCLYKCWIVKAYRCFGGIHINCYQNIVDRLPSSGKHHHHRWMLIKNWHFITSSHNFTAGETFYIPAEEFH